MASLDGRAPASGLVLRIRMKTASATDAAVVLESDWLRRHLYRSF